MGATATGRGAARAAVVVEEVGRGLAGGIGTVMGAAAGGAGGWGGMGGASACAGGRGRGVCSVRGLFEFSLRSVGALCINGHVAKLICQTGMQLTEVAIKAAFAIRS